MAVMVQGVQRFMHLVINTLGKEFKHDSDEFSLILSSVEKNRKRAYTAGKVSHMYFRKRSFHTAI